MLGKCPPPPDISKILVVGLSNGSMWKKKHPLTPLPNNATKKKRQNKLKTTN
jgi:hypothetical protein